MCSFTVLLLIDLVAFAWLIRKLFATETTVLVFLSLHVGVIWISAFFIGLKFVDFMLYCEIIVNSCSLRVSLEYNIYLPLRLSSLNGFILLLILIFMLCLVLVERFECLIYSLSLSLLLVLSFPLPEDLSDFIYF